MAILSIIFCYCGESNFIYVVLCMCLVVCAHKGDSGPKAHVARKRTTKMEHFNWSLSPVAQRQTIAIE